MVSPATLAFVFPNAFASIFALLSAFTYNKQQSQPGIILGIVPHIANTDKTKLYFTSNSMSCYNKN